MDRFNDDRTHQILVNTGAIRMTTSMYASEKEWTFNKMVFFLITSEILLAILYDKSCLKIYISDT